MQEVRVPAAPDDASCVRRACAEDIATDVTTCTSWSRSARSTGCRRVARPSSRGCRRGRALLLSAIAVGCTGDIATVTWTPLDIDALEDDIESPTAPLNEDTLAEVHADLVDVAPLLRGLLQIGGMLVDLRRDGPVEVETRDLDVDLTGTQVYIRIACPGPIAIVPDPEFGYGSLTVYSAALSEDAIDTWGAHGDMLGVLDECVVGSSTVDGRMRMYYDTIRNLLGSEYEIEWASGGASGRVAVRVLDEHDALDPTEARTRLLFTTAASGTLVIEQSLDTELTRYIVRGVDGEIVCNAIDEPPCPPL